MMRKFIIAVILSLTMISCSQVGNSQVTEIVPTMSAQVNSGAKITEVKATGKPDNYTFAVTVSSPDTGCDRYADWWEVVTPEGELIYRRVLLHSHVNEQPFQRTGGTVAIQPQQEVIVRVHMSDSGYSTTAQQGTVASGFATTTLSPDFALDLANVEPLPGDCAF